MFDIKQYDSCDGTGNSAERDEQYTNNEDDNLSDIDIPVVSKQPSRVTRSEGDEPTTADDVHIESQAIPPADVNIQPDVPVVQGRSSCSTVPTQANTHPPAGVAASSQPPPLVLATKPNLKAAIETARTQGPNSAPTIHIENTCLGDSFTTRLQLPPTLPSLLTAPVPQAQANTPGLSQSPSPGVDVPIPALPEAGGESLWMQQKETLKYFKKIMKEGHLSALIPNWYRLEKLLGFPEQVRSLFVRGPYACSRPDRLRRNSRYGTARR